MSNTDWTKYGRGNDPRCEDCMMHSGYEPSAILGGNKKLGDTWRMLTWQLSGRMGGAKGAPKSNGPRGNGHSNGHSNGVRQRQSRTGRRLRLRSPAKKRFFAFYEDARHGRHRLRRQPRSGSSSRRRAIAARSHPPR